MKTLRFKVCSQMVVAAVVTLIAFCGFSLNARAADEEAPKQLVGVGIQEKLGESIDLNLAFSDHTGKPVRLSDYAKAGKPIILSLNYFTCATLCSLQMNALTKGLHGLEWAPGENYRVITVSIDPKDTARAASEKRALYLSQLGKGDKVEWDFLTGSEENIQTLSKSVGFNYKYVADQKQFAHGAAIYFITGSGKISRYLYGIDYPSFDLKMAVTDAAEGKIALSSIEQFVMNCFHYDATVGRYGPHAVVVMRIGGIITVLIMGFWLAKLWRRERLKSLKECRT